MSYEDEGVLFGHPRGWSELHFWSTYFSMLTKKTKLYAAVSPQVTHSLGLKMKFEENKTAKSYFSCSLSSFLSFWVGERKDQRKEVWKRGKNEGKMDGWKRETMEEKKDERKVGRKKGWMDGWRRKR